MFTLSIVTHHTSRLPEMIRWMFCDDSLRGYPHHLDVRCQVMWLLEEHFQVRRVLLNLATVCDHVERTYPSRPFCSAFCTYNA